MQFRSKGDLLPGELVRTGDEVTGIKYEGKFGHLLLMMMILFCCAASARQEEDWRGLGEGQLQVRTSCPSPDPQTYPLDAQVC